MLPPKSDPPPPAVVRTDCVRADRGVDTVGASGPVAREGVSDA